MRQLSYVGKIRGETDGRVAKGISDCGCFSSKKAEASDLWLTSGFQGVKSATQLVIWEWVSLWLMMCTFLTTLLYNGFVTKQMNNDSWPRLVVVILYSFSFALHFGYTLISVLRMAKFTVASAAWNMLQIANFAVIDRTQLVDYNNQPEYNEPREFREMELSTMGKAFHPGTITAKLPKRAERAQPNPPNYGENSTKKSALEHVEGLRELESKRLGEAADAALERVILNSAIMLGISVITAFSTWTAKNLTDNTSAQLGSLSLLASTSLGFGAMLSSAPHIRTFCKSAEQVLEKKEVLMNGKAVEFDENRMNIGAVGFALFESLEARKVTLWDLLKGLSGWRLIAVVFLGPACALLPSKKESSSHESNPRFKFNIKIGDRDVVFTTGITGIDNANPEIIKVFYKQPLGNNLEPQQ